MRLKPMLMFYLTSFSQMIGTSVGNPLLPMHQRHAENEDNSPLGMCPADLMRLPTLLPPRWLPELMQPTTTTVLNGLDRGEMDGSAAKNDEKDTAGAIQNLRFFSQNQAACKVQALSETVPCVISSPALSTPKLRRQHTALRAYGEKLIPEIRKLLPTLFPPKVLLPILSDPSFSIALAFRNPRDIGTKEGSKGSYDSQTNTVTLGIAGTHWTDAELQVTLKNELHHALIRCHNVHVMNSGSLPQSSVEMNKIAYPFFPRTTGYTQDTHLVNKLRKSSKEGLDRLKSLKKIIKKSRNPGKFKLSSDEKAQLKTFKEIILRYEPQIHEIPGPDEDYSNGKFNAGRLKKLKEQISENDFPKLRVDHGSLYIRELHACDDGFVFLKGTYNADDSWQAKAEALFGDLKYYRGSMKEPGYKEGTPDRKVAEFSSFLQELPQSVLRFIFPEWCKYFDDYFELNDGDYCADIPLPLEDAKFRCN